MPFSDVTGAQPVHHPGQKGISEVVNFEFKIKLRWYIHREHFELRLASDLQGRDLSQNAFQLGFKLFLRYRVQGWEVKNLAEVLEMTSQRDCRDYTFPFQV